MKLHFAGSALSFLNNKNITHYRDPQFETSINSMSKNQYPYDYFEGFNTTGNRKQAIQYFLRGLYELPEFQTIMHYTEDIFVVNVSQEKSIENHLVLQVPSRENPNKLAELSVDLSNIAKLDGGFRINSEPLKKTHGQVIKWLLEQAESYWPEDLTRIAKETKTNPFDIYTEFKTNLEDALTYNHNQLNITEKGDGYRMGERIVRIIPESVTDEMLSNFNTIRTPGTGIQSYD